MSNVVITGSSKGIGRGLAEEFAKRGHNVTVSARGQASIDSTVEALNRLGGGKASGYPCDVSRKEQVRALWNHSKAEFGTVDYWINNAGTTAPSGDGDLVPRAMGELLIRVNTLGTYHGSVTAMRQFRRQGHGRLINITGRGERGPVRRHAHAPVRDGHAAKILGRPTCFCRAYFFFLRHLCNTV